MSGGFTYNVGVHLTATNQISSVLAVIGRDMLGLHGTVEKLQKSIGQLRMGVMGALSLGAGIGGLKELEHLVAKGNDWVKISRDMAQAGVSNTQIMAAQAEAIKLTGQYANMSSVEVMKLQNDARMTFGDQDSATHHIEPFVQMASFLKSYQGAEKGKHNSESLMHEINAAMKSGEIAGKISPADMTEHVKQLTAMKVAYGEQLKISQYLTAQRSAGVAMRNTSDAFRYGMFPALVQENGSGAGTMLMTAFNKVVAGVGNRTNSLEYMNKLGLLNRDQLDYDKVGRVKGLKDPEGIKGSREAAMNFGSWVMTTLKPLLDKETGGDHIKEAQAISKMFPDRNAAKAITEILQQFTKLSKDADMMAQARRALNMGAYNAGSWDYQVQSFTTQWRNLMTHLGAPMVEGATRALSKLNEAIAGMSQWMAINPEKARMIGTALTAVSAGLAAMGTVLIGSALVGAIGAGGWLIGGIAALGGALAAFSWMRGWQPDDSHVRNADHDPAGPKTQGRGANGPGAPKRPAFDADTQSGQTFADAKKYWSETWTRLKQATSEAGEVLNSIGVTIHGAIMTLRQRIVDTGSVLSQGFDKLKEGLGQIPALFTQIGSSVSSGVASIREALGQIPSAISEMAGKITTAVGALPGQVAGAISAAFAAIGAAIASAIAGLVNFAKVAPTDGTGSRDGAVGGVGKQFRGGRASGGAVSPGQRYRVGEQGEEEFVPNVPGRIVPHYAAFRHNQGGGSSFVPPPGQRPVIVEATFVSQLDGRTVARSVGRHLASEASHSVGLQDTYGSYGHPGSAFTG